MCRNRNKRSRRLTNWMGSQSGQMNGVITILLFVIKLCVCHDFVCFLCFESFLSEFSSRFVFHFPKNGKYLSRVRAHSFIFWINFSFEIVRLSTTRHSDATIRTDIELLSQTIWNFRLKLFSEFSFFSVAVKLASSNFFFFCCCRYANSSALANGYCSAMIRNEWNALHDQGKRKREREK